MPAGMPYFAWIDSSETVFGSEHLRWDESVFSFNLSQDEGDPAHLTTVVRRPRNTSGDPIGLLGPGRAIWCWFAFDCGPDLIRFRGRLVGVPTSIFEELVTLEFVAKPIDLVAQKEALANTLRVLPFYDEVVIDPARRTDSDLVLEGYTAIWHYDRETHVITISDEITGEDGTVSFDGGSEGGKVLFDGLGLTLTSGPLARVDVTAEFNWTQQARGTVDLTGYLVGHWPNPPGSTRGTITSYTLTAADWPKTGAGIGDGWVVAHATAFDLYDWTVKTTSESQSLTIIGPDGSTSKSSITASNSYVGSYAGTHAQFPAIVTKDEWSASYGTDGDGLLYPQSFTRSFEAVGAVVAQQSFKPTLIAGFTAQRPCTEIVSFTLFANVQPILTDPEDGEALRIDNIRSINLSEGPSPPIGDVGRRSYIATARGNQSLEHLIVLARAHLMKRARVVQISFAPKLSRMPEITLRKSAFLAEPRVGEALGKIIGYSLALDGSDGQIKCEVRIGCTIGYGGVVTAVDGTSTYSDSSYVGTDYQQFIGRTALVDSSVGYQPPSSAPNDDGITFPGSAANFIEQPLVVKFGPLEQQDAFADLIPSGAPTGGYRSELDKSVTAANKKLEARAQMIKDFLKAHETHATFKLKSMNREFTTEYEIQVTDLMIPAGYDLEAV